MVIRVQKLCYYNTRAKKGQLHGPMERSVKQTGRTEPLKLFKKGRMQHDNSTFRL